MPQPPATSTTSSKVTCNAPTGSITPPTYAAAERRTRLPLSARGPTSPCRALLGPAPSGPPTLRYIRGLPITPDRTYAPPASGRGAAHGREGGAGGGALPGGPWPQARR